MPCDGAIQPLDGTGDGSVTALSVTATGQITLLSCCDDPPTQPQALVKHWKKTREDLFTTTPLPFGASSFSTAGMYAIAGPPKPGEDTRLSGGSVIVPPAQMRPPRDAPLPPSTSTD